MKVYLLVIYVFLDLINTWKTEHIKIINTITTYYWYQ